MPGGQSNWSGRQFAKRPELSQAVNSIHDSLTHGGPITVSGPTNSWTIDTSTINSLSPLTNDTISRASNASYFSMIGATMTDLPFTASSTIDTMKLDTPFTASITIDTVRTKIMTFTARCTTDSLQINSAPIYITFAASSTIATITTVATITANKTTNPLTPEMTSAAMSTIESLTIAATSIDDTVAATSTTDSSTINRTTTASSTASGTFDLKLDIDQGPYAFVSSVDPPWHGDVPVNTQVVFELTIVPAVTPEASDQVFLFPMQVLTDSGAVLGEWDLVLVLTP